MMTMPHEPRPLEIVAELSEWRIDLTTGDRLLVTATAFSKVEGFYCFKNLMKGSPHYEMTVAQIPDALVESIESLSSGGA